MNILKTLIVLTFGLIGLYLYIDVLLFNQGYTNENIMQLSFASISMSIFILIINYKQMKTTLLKEYILTSTLIITLIYFTGSKNNIDWSIAIFFGISSFIIVLNMFTNIGLARNKKTNN